MGYQKSNMLKTLNHWQSIDEEYGFIQRDKGQIISKILIDNETYYIPPYLRFKSSIPKGIAQSPIGELDFDNMNLYKGEKYNDNINNVIRYRGVMSFGTEVLEYSPPEGYPAFEYWENTIHFKVEYNGPDLIYNKTGQKQDVIENIIVPKINRIGIFYAWSRPEAVSRLPSWLSKFSETTIKFGLSNTMSYSSDLIRTAEICPSLFNKGIKIPRNSVLQKGYDGLIDSDVDYPLIGFNQSPIDLEGKANYLNGGNFLPLPLRLNPVKFPCILIGKITSSPVELGTPMIYDNIYIDKNNNNIAKTVVTCPAIYENIRDENGTKIAGYMFTLDYLIEELIPIKAQTIVKMIWEE